MKHFRIRRLFPDEGIPLREAWGPSTAVVFPEGITGKRPGEVVGQSARRPRCGRPPGGSSGSIEEELTPGVRVPRCDVRAAL